MHEFTWLVDQEDKLVGQSKAKLVAKLEKLKNRNFATANRLPHAALCKVIKQFVCEFDGRKKKSWKRWGD